MEKFFNKEMNKLIVEKKHEVLLYLDEKFRISCSKDYYNFLDTYLFKYGLLSMNYIHHKGNKYIPYMNFSKENIFNMESGIIEFPEEFYGLRESQETLARNLVNLLTSISIKNFENYVEY